MNYDLNKVIGENETGFRGQADLIYRTEGWDFLWPAARLYNNFDYSFTASASRWQSAGIPLPRWRQPITASATPVLKEFLQAFDLVRMRPRYPVIQHVSDQLVASALSVPNREYAVYLHVPLPGKVKSLDSHRRQEVKATLQLNLPRGDFHAEWIDTKTGAILHVDDYHHDGGTRNCQVPPFDDDIALRLRRTSKPGR